jgi:hypothetical protein
VLTHFSSDCGVGNARALVREFADYVLDAYDLKEVMVQPGLVTFLTRPVYMAHPRATNLEPSRMIDNLVSR